MFKSIIINILRFQFHIYVLSCLVITWYNPYLINQGVWVKNIAYIMIMEIVLINSSAIMTAFLEVPKIKQKKVLIWMGFFAVYSLFAISIALGAKNIFIFVGFVSMMVGRFINQIVYPSDKFTKFSLITAFASIPILLLTPIIALYVSLPEFGLSQDIARKILISHDPNLISSNEDPRFYFYWGFFYFFFSFIMNMIVVKIMPKLKKPIQIH